MWEVYSAQLHNIKTQTRRKKLSKVTLKFIEALSWCNIKETTISPPALMPVQQKSGTRPHHQSDRLQKVGESTGGSGRQRDRCECTESNYVKRATGRANTHTHFAYFPVLGATLSLLRWRLGNAEEGEEFLWFFSFKVGLIARTLMHLHTNDYRQQTEGFILF